MERVITVFRFRLAVWLLTAAILATVMSNNYATIRAMVIMIGPSSWSSSTHLIAWWIILFFFLCALLVFSVFFCWWNGTCFYQTDFLRVLETVDYELLLLHVFRERGNYYYINPFLNFCVEKGELIRNSYVILLRYEFQFFLCNYNGTISW